MPDPDPPKADVTVISTVDVEPRFTNAGPLVRAAVGAAIALCTLILFVVWRTDVFKDKIEYSAGDGKTKTVESTFQYTTAKFTIVMFILLGVLALVAGAVLAALDMVKSTTTTQETKVPVVQDPTTGERRVMAAAGATTTGVAAVVSALAEAFKGVGGVLKELKAAGAMIFVGMALFIAAGAIAWNTIPGTDKSPTFTVPAAEEEGTPTSDSTPPSEPETSDPTTSDPATSEADTSDPATGDTDAPTTTG